MEVITIDNNFNINIPSYMDYATNTADFLLAAVDPKSTHELIAMSFGIGMLAIPYAIPIGLGVMANGIFKEDEVDSQKEIDIKEQEDLIVKLIQALSEHRGPGKVDESSIKILSFEDPEVIAGYALASNEKTELYVTAMMVRQKVYSSLINVAGLDSRDDRVCFVEEFLKSIQKLDQEKVDKNERIKRERLEKENAITKEEVMEEVLKVLEKCKNTPLTVDEVVDDLDYKYKKIKVQSALTGLVNKGKVGRNTFQAIFCSRLL